MSELFSCRAANAAAAGAKIPRKGFLDRGARRRLLLCLRIAFGGETAQAALAFAVLGILTVVALMDMDTLEIYDRFPVLLFVCGIAAHILIPSPGIKSRLIGCVIVSLPMLLLALIVPGRLRRRRYQADVRRGLFPRRETDGRRRLYRHPARGGFGALLLAAKEGESKEPFRLRSVLCIGIAPRCSSGRRLADWYIGLL